MAALKGRAFSPEECFVASILLERQGKGTTEEYLQKKAGPPRDDEEDTDNPGHRFSVAEPLKWLRQHGYADYAFTQDGEPVREKYEITETGINALKKSWKGAITACERRKADCAREETDAQTKGVYIRIGSAKLRSAQAISDVRIMAGWLLNALKERQPPEAEVPVYAPREARTAVAKAARAKGGGAKKPVRLAP